MEQTTLKKIRLAYPGVILIIVGLLFFNGGNETSIIDTIKDGLEVSIDAAIPTLFIFMFGTMYYALSIRNVIWRPAMKKVGDNINHELLKIVGLDPKLTLTKEQKSSIESCVFYHFIDNDASLTMKSLNVKYNGCILSCITDNLLILTFSLLVFMFISLITNNPLGPKFWLVLIFDIFSLIAFFPLLNKHIALSNEQLLIIKKNYSADCKGKMLSIMQSEIG